MEVVFYAVMAFIELVILLGIIVLVYCERRNLLLLYRSRIRIICITILLMLILISLYTYAKYEQPNPAPMPMMPYEPHTSPVPPWTPYSRSDEITASATILVIGLPPSSLRIDVEIPSPMIVKCSHIIKVSLLPKNKPVVPARKGTSTESSDARAVNGENTPLVDTFGPEYKPVVDASLYAGRGTFNIDPIPPSNQDLSQQELTWKWAVKPLVTGPSQLAITITITWNYIATNESNKLPRIIGEHIFDVKVSEPEPTPTSTVVVEPVHIDIGAIAKDLLPYLLGSGGVIACAYLWIRKKLRRKRKRPVTAEANLVKEDKTP